MTRRGSGRGYRVRVVVLLSGSSVKEGSGSSSSDTMAVYSKYTCGSRQVWRVGSPRTWGEGRVVPSITYPTQTPSSRLGSCPGSVTVDPSGTRSFVHVYTCPPRGSSVAQSGETRRVRSGSAGPLDLVWTGRVVGQGGQDGPHVSGPRKV